MVYVSAVQLLKLGKNVPVVSNNKHSKLIDGKVLSCMFFFLAILGVDPAQNLAKYKRWLRAFIQLTNRSIVVMVITPWKMRAYDFYSRVEEYQKTDERVSVGKE